MLSPSGTSRWSGTPRRARTCTVLFPFWASDGLIRSCVALSRTIVIGAFSDGVTRMWPAPLRSRAKPGCKGQSRERSFSTAQLGLPQPVLAPSPTGYFPSYFTRGYSFMPVWHPPARVTDWSQARNPMTTEPVRLERRVGQSFDLHVPVSVKLAGTQHEAAVSPKTSARAARFSIPISL